MAGEGKSRLGRGLDALLGAEGPQEVSDTGARLELAVDIIDQNPYQPRKEFDSDELEALGESIRNHGVLQPLVVRQLGDRFQLIAGERRLRAAQAVGLPAVPVTIVQFNDQQVLEAALVENIQRADLNPIEKASGFKEYLTRYHMTHEQLAARLGLGRATITNLVALLELHPEVQKMIRLGELSFSHAKLLKGDIEPDRQLNLAREMVARGLSVKAAETHIKLQKDEMASEEEQSIAGSSGSSRAASEKTSHVMSLENELRQKLGLKVEIRVKGQDKGQIVLNFATNDDFERAIDCLRN